MGSGYFAGIDIGSSATKTVIIDGEGKIVGSCSLKTGISYSKVANECFALAMKDAGITCDQIKATVTTGYGRRNTPISDAMRTEISCISKGAYHYFPQLLSVIDIGGQDNKMIQLDSEGRRLDFQMNRKCAAGTGAFLEEIANRLDLPISKLQELARKSTKRVVLGSYCTVFTFTEILAHLDKGVGIEDLARGVMFSIVKRIYEFGIQSDDLVLCGGVVEHNPLIAEMLQEEFKVNVLLPPHPQMVCAMGAALYARENHNSA